MNGQLQACTAVAGAAILTVVMKAKLPLTWNGITGDNVNLSVRT